MVDYLRNLQSLEWWLDSLTPELAGAAITAFAVYLAFRLYENLKSREYLRRYGSLVVEEISRLRSLNDDAIDFIREHTAANDVATARKLAESASALSFSLVRGQLLIGNLRQMASTSDLDDLSDVESDFSRCGYQANKTITFIDVRSRYSLHDRTFKALLDVSGELRNTKLTDAFLADFQAFGLAGAELKKLEAVVDLQSTINKLAKICRLSNDQSEWIVDADAAAQREFTEKIAKAASAKLEDLQP